MIGWSSSTAVVRQVYLAAFPVKPLQRDQGYIPFSTAVPFGDKSLKLYVNCPQNGTAVLKGLSDQNHCTSCAVLSGIYIITRVLSVLV